VQIPRSLATLDRIWIDPPGYFCRAPGLPQVKFAFTNYGISLGLQAVQRHPDRVARINGSSTRIDQGTNTTARRLRTSWRAHRIFQANSFVAIGRRKGKQTWLRINS
jgi:hypothetical protein